MDFFDGGTDRTKGFTTTTVSTKAQRKAYLSTGETIDLRHQEKVERQREKVKERSQAQNRERAKKRRRALRDGLITTSEFLALQARGKAPAKLSLHWRRFKRLFKARSRHISPRYRNRSLSPVELRALNRPSGQQPTIGKGSWPAERLYGPDTGLLGAHAPGEETCEKFPRKPAPAVTKAKNDPNIETVENDGEGHFKRAKRLAAAGHHNFGSTSTAFSSSQSQQGSYENQEHVTARLTDEENPFSDDFEAESDEEETAMDGSAVSRESVRHLPREFSNNDDASSNYSGGNPVGFNVSQFDDTNIGLSNTSGKLQETNDSERLAAEYIQEIGEVDQSFEGTCYMRGGAGNDYDGETYLGDDFIPSPVTDERAAFIFPRGIYHALTDSSSSIGGKTSTRKSLEEQNEEEEDETVDPFEYERYLTHLNPATEARLQKELNDEGSSQLPFQLQKPPTLRRRNAVHFHRGVNSQSRREHQLPREPFSREIAWNEVEGPTSPSPKDPREPQSQRKLNSQTRAQASLPAHWIEDNNSTTLKRPSPVFQLPQKALWNEVNVSTSPSRRLSREFRTAPRDVSWLESAPRFLMQKPAQVFHTTREVLWNENPISLSERVPLILDAAFLPDIPRSQQYNTLSQSYSSLANPPVRLFEGDPYPPETSFEEAAAYHGYVVPEASGPTISPGPLTPSSSTSRRTISISKSISAFKTSPNSPLVSAFSNISKRLRKTSKLSTPSTPVPDERTLVEMENRLTVAPRSEQKTKAVEDARKMQAYVVEECKKSGKDPPPFALEELIGKGSFGRVYKGKDMTTAKVVAIKIVDIDESDTLNPKNSDAYSEFLKEVNALKLLGENKAKNINLVLEALPVGKAMWMITEHCGGGSVATLMKPTLPKGLQEKWVRTILREAAEGLCWVHQVGIIHRDIKSANVLVTENGDVQLCDFGVAGIIENKTDKRSTIIGTPHWMAPELLTENGAASYGKEIDIWAFGAMAYEMASGLPPSATIPMSQLQTYLKQNSPRLPEGTYSENLREIVAICLQNNPQARPTIEEVQKHRYIYNTSDSYPTANLRALILSYRKWESDGGTRKSLFWQHGAQPPVMISSTEDDDWNFSVTDDFDDKLSSDFQDMANAYRFPNDDASRTARPVQQQARPSRRRPPPEALNRGLSVGPLEKLFDPNTLTSYNDNIVARYGKQSDLPLRDDSTDTSIRDTMIDLGGHDVDTGISSFSDMDTIRANRRGQDESSDHLSSLHDFSRPALSDPADANPNRRTQDWKFPSAAAPPASADPEVSRFPISYEVPRPTVTPAFGDRPALIHHPTEPLGPFVFGGGSVSSVPSVPSRMTDRESLIDLDLSQRLSMRDSLINLDLDMGIGMGMHQRTATRESLIDLDMGDITASQNQRASTSSLIDLDMSLPDPVPFRGIPDIRSVPEYQRPSTANSDVGSTTSEQMASGNPFEFERHPSLYMPVSNPREPSIYVSDSTTLPQSLQNGNINAFHEAGEMSDFSGASDAEGYVNDRYVASSQYGEETNGYYEEMQRGRTQQYGVQEEERMPPPPRPLQPHPLRTSSRLAMPPLPAAPSARISTGRADAPEVQSQLTLSIGDITAALQGFRNIYDSQDVLQRRGSGMKKDRREPPPRA